MANNKKELTDFGLAKKLAVVDSYSSSGSGWQYGATVTLICKETGDEAVVTTW